MISIYEFFDSKQKTIEYVKTLKEKITVLEKKIEPLKKEFTDLIGKKKKAN